MELVLEPVPPDGHIHVIRRILGGTGAKAVQPQGELIVFPLVVPILAAGVKLTAVIEHYHNSSWLEHGGSPEKAAKSAFVGAIDGWIRQNNKYQKSESKITWADIEDCLVLVSSNFSTQTSYPAPLFGFPEDRFCQRPFPCQFHHVISDPVFV